MHNNLNAFLLKVSKANLLLYFVARLDTKFQKYGHFTFWVKLLTSLEWPVSLVASDCNVHARESIDIMPSI